MNNFSFSFQGEALLADCRGALYWPARKMLIVSDLHFEKGSAFAGKGVLLPPYDTRATLTLLESLCQQYCPETVLSLGDAFHDKGAETRLAHEDEKRLSLLTERHQWIWVLGNHDPVPPKRFAGEAVEHVSFDALHFCHEAETAPRPGEISGHYHPAVKINAEGRSLRRRCFVMDHQRMILPAMGAFTGGLNILDEAIQPLFSENYHVLVLGKSRIYPISPCHLIPDGRSIRALDGQSRQVGVKKMLSGSQKAG